MSDAAAPPPPDPPQPPAAGTRRRRAVNVVARLTALGFPPAVAPHLPLTHWLVDLPASFALHGGAVLLLGLTVLSLGRRPWLAAFWAGGVLAAALAVAPGWLAAGRIPATGGAPLVVLGMNLERGGEANADRALAEIARVAPDILALSEVTPAWRQAIEPGLDAFPHRLVDADPGWFGIALYSRLPLANAEVVPLPMSWAPAIRATATTAAGPVGVLAVHAPRPGRGSRCDERDAALLAIADALRPLPQRRVVFGDFNCTPWNRAFPRMLQATGLHHASGARPRPTWTTHWPWPLRVPIDHVLTSDGIGVEHVEVGPAFGSDHLPLSARLRL